ncbi:2OG-Fe(II) oxygenase [Paraburkholderia sp. DHOC27]|uniref:2OG-Fe(II) oxygenase n=1 Tax=Paraburkholderia sp. DHOC27 TaxID=2303330 RepID=UPI000E3C3B5F|nr:2OG-Fe(II) oxygenase [Paraburkholderia sp. DHOC27]RFU44601.1 2-oxoglutarate-dependent dioxygenase [Paraburkholderia sp. DHOC27]
MPVLDAAWEDWLATNAKRGCTADSMVESMVQAGFDVMTAAAAVQRVLVVTSGGVVAAANAANAASPIAPSALTAAHAGTEATLVKSAPGAYQYDAVPVAAGNLIRAFDRDVKVLMRCERPQVIVFGDVLSADECAEMIERSRHRLKRSTTVNPATGQEDVIRNRTSEGIWFQRGEDALIERIDQRIASLTNWPVENGEGLQILHYNTTGEYRPHFDYFPPDQAGSAVHTARGGQRVATLIVYLNDVPDGGETIFPEAGLAVAGKQGGAVYFRYLNGQRQLDPLTLHGGAPVKSGDKWIMTKWMRERPYV